MIDGKPRIGDEVYIHGYIDEIRKDVVIIRNEGGYFGTSDKEMFYYEEDERGYGTMNEADRKTENCSEKPNNSTISKMEQVEDESQKNCYTCRHLRVCDIRDITNEFCRYESRYDPQTCSVNGRPYTDCSRCEYFRCTADEPQAERSE